MQPVSDLWDLVHSMSPHEKRYFRLQAGSHVRSRDNRYLHLYEAVLAQDSPDDQALRAAYGNSQSASAFSVAKHDLIQLLLQALRDYHREKEMQMNLRQLLDQVELLYARSLYDMCRRWLRKARKQGEALEATAFLFELIEWEIRLVKRNPSQDMARRISDLRAEKEHLHRRMRIGMELRELHDQVFGMLQQRGLQDASHNQVELDSLLRHPAMLADPQEMDFDSRIVWAYTHAYAAQLQGASRAVLSRFQELVAIWEASPVRIRFEKQRYLNTLRTLIDYSMDMQQLEGLPALLEKLKALAAQWKLPAAQRLQLIDHLEMRFLLNTGALDQAEQVAPAWEAAFEAEGTQLNLNTRLAFFYNFTTLYFFLDQPRKSLRWLRQILNHPASASRTDIQRFARMMQLMLHVELGNTDLLEHLLTTSRRYLKKSGNLDPLGAALLEFVREVLASPADAWRGHARTLYERVAALDPDEQLGTDEVRYWAEARARGVALRRIVQPG